MIEIGEALRLIRDALERARKISDEDNLWASVRVTVLIPTNVNIEKPIGFDEERILDLNPIWSGAESIRWYDKYKQYMYGNSYGGCIEDVLREISNYQVLSISGMRSDGHQFWYNEW